MPEKCPLEPEIIQARQSLVPGTQKSLLCRECEGRAVVEKIIGRDGIPTFTEDMYDCEVKKTKNTGLNKV